MEDRWIGLILAISSSVAIGLSFIITKKGLQDSNEKSQKYGNLDGSHSASDKLIYLRNPIWWAGMTMMVVGEVANFAAYTFAPPVLVTPLGALSVIFGAILASFLLNEKLGPVGRVGCGLCVVGSLVIILHAPEDKEVTTVDEILHYAIQLPFIIYCVIVTIFTIGMIYKVVPKYGKKTPIVYISICSMVGSISVMSIKGFGVALKLTFAGNNQLTHISTYIFAIVVAICILIQMNYFNKALDTFSTNVVNPIYYVMFSTATIFASFVLFQGFYETPTRDIISVIAGFLTIFAGVYLLNKSRSIDTSNNNRQGVNDNVDPRHSISGRLSSVNAGGTMIDPPYRSREDYEEYELPRNDNEIQGLQERRSESDDGMDDYTENYNKATLLEQEPIMSNENQDTSNIENTENVAEGGDEGNLEYWNYIGRADTLVDINQHDDPVDRMLSVARFCFAKDLRFVRGGVVKPYNSVMGEHFRCSWPATLPNYNNNGEFDPTNDLTSDYDQSSQTTPAPKGPGVGTQDGRKSHAVSGDLKDVDALNHREGKGKISFLTEQISHHPPVSAYWYSANESNIEVYGVDQVSAKISGTSIKVMPGERNNGIFINLKDKNEEYHLTHPTALVSGILRGLSNIYAVICDSSIIEVSGKNENKLRMIIEYKEESWIGKPRFLIEGVMYEVTTNESKEWNKVKQVPKDQILVTLEGSWRSEIRYKKVNEDESKMLIDLNKLDLTPKFVRDLEKQDDLESRKVWEPVTEAILEKDYNKATKAKQAIEHKQREAATERKNNNESYESCYFELETPGGKPILKDKGKEALKSELSAEF